MKNLHPIVQFVFLLIQEPIIIVFTIPIVIVLCVLLYVIYQSKQAKKREELLKNVERINI